MKKRNIMGLNKKALLLALPLTGALIPSVNSSADGFSEFWQNLSFSGVYTYLRALGSRGLDRLFNFFSSLVGKIVANISEGGSQEEEPSSENSKNQSKDQAKDTLSKTHSEKVSQEKTPFQTALDILKQEGGGISKSKERVKSLLGEIKKGLGEDISNKIHLEYDEDEALFKGTVDVLGKKIPLGFVGVEAGHSVSPNFLLYEKYLGPGKPTRKKHDEKEMLEETINAFKKWYMAVKSIFDYCEKLKETEVFDVDESQKENGELTFKVKKEYKVSIATYGHHGYRSPGEYTIQLDKLIFGIGKAKIGVYEKSNVIYVMYPNKVYNDENLEEFEEKILKNVLNNAEKIKEGEEVKIFTNEESDGATTSV